MPLASRARKLLLLAFTLLLGSWLLSGPLGSSPGNGGGNGGHGSGYAPYVPGEVLIKFKDAAGPNERANLRAQLNAQKVRGFRSGAEQWRLGAGQDTERAIAQHRGNPHVQYVEPNYLIQMDAVPNDARYGELWGMNNTGQTGGTPGADIDAERAWNVSTGSSDVVVAVIDTGIDYNHPDLAANAWTNPGEIAGNGVDDDGNGFIDDIHGWDFYNNDNDPFDDNGHGSHCSGTIGGVGNNGIGVAGVNWDVSIMGVKFLSGGGSGTTAGAIASVDYATLMGVDIMSNSWGGGGFSQALLDSINAAAAQEIVFVAAAGNSGSNNDLTPHYPSSYNAPNIIAVMATDDNDVRSIWPSGNSSSYGATSVDIGAPGSDILSTTPGNTYSVYSGTSMATPHVSGAAALLRAVAPNTSAVLVRQILMNLAEPLPSLAGLCVSGARLNAFFPIAEPDDVPPGTIGDLASTGATSNSLFLGWTATGDDGSTGTAAGYDLRYSTAPIDALNFDAAAKAAGVAPPGPYGTPQSTEVVGLTAGTPYYFALKAKDEWGNVGPISNIATGTTLPPPTFASSPDSFSADLLTGQTASRTLTLQNAGVGTLDWRIPLPSVTGPVTVQYEPLALGKEEPDPRPGVPALAGFGGPDIFGYRWMDSDELGGPVFSWTDIALTGTQVALTGDDSNAGPIPIGFNFPFYGNTFDSVRVSTNGWISFTSTATSYANQPLPNSAGPENLIAAFWDDLNFGAVQRAVYENVGGNFVIQFTGVPPYSGTGAFTFQIELLPGGEIRLRYLTVAGAVTSATVGIQNAAKDDGLTVVFNDAYLHDNLEIRIAAVPQWLTAAPTSGRLYPGQTADVTVGIDASGLDGGTYEGSVHVETNDPTQPVVGHPVTLNVTGAPAISVSPLSLDFGQVYTGFSSTQTVSINNTGTDALTVSSIVPADPQVSVSPSSVIVPAHAGATVSVTYTPASPSTLATTLAINSDASNAAQVIVDVAGFSLPAPAMLVSPASFDETLYTGGTVARNLRVRNSGGSNLNVTLTTELGSATQVPAPSVEVAKGDESDAGTGDNVIERAGGPDAFGYRYKDSDAPGGPTFGWVDISGIGTPIPFTGTEPDDTNFGPISLGFNVDFYGTTFNSIRACTNGWISFTSTSTSLGNVNLPSGGTSAPNNLIAAFWDDLRFYTANGARAYTYNDGSRFIVQFKNVSKFGQASTSRMNFEFILYPSGKIVIQYLDMSGTLNSATIGIQNAARTVGLSTSFNENYVHGNMAIEYARIPDWMMVSPTSATIPPGGFRDFSVSFNAGDSGNRVFQGNVHIATNIPDPPFLNVPARLTVLGVADVATDPTSVDYGPRFVGYPHLRKVYVKNVGTADLTVFGVTSSDPALFVEEPIAGAAQFTIPAGGQVEYNLRWLPTSAGPLNAAVTVASDDPDEATIVVPVVGTALDPPILGYSPGSFSGSLYVGETSASMLHLENTGGSDLAFNVGVRLTDAIVLQDNSPEIPKGMEPTVFGAPVATGSGGPDMFGYRWKDSDEPGGPAFDWFDISTIGTPIAGLDGDDEYSGAINLGFAFPFYSNTFNQVRVSTNGWLSFSAPTTSRNTNYVLPSTNGEANMLAPMWDDLHFNGTERARTYSDGTRFVLQYTNVAHYGSTGTTSYTFQAILYPSGKIVYQYLTLTGGRTNENTVGIQNTTKDDGLNIAYNQAYLHDNLAIEIQTVADWLTVDVSSGTIPAGGSLDIPVHFDATELIGGLYSGGLRILSNDPASGLVEIPATLAVTGFPGIAAAPASLDFGTVFVGVSATLPVTISNPGSDVLHVTGIATTGDYSTDTTPFDLAPRGTRILNVAFAPSVDGTRTGSIDLASNATGMPLISVPLTGNGLYPPVAGLDPETVAEVAANALPPAGMKTETVRLCNTGGSDLEWSAGVNLQASAGAPPEPAVQAAVELPKGDTSADGTGLHIERAGGPDAFGYRYRDSDEAGGPAFDWFDISVIGTPVAGLDSDDEYVGPLAIPFNFPYYGGSFNQIWLSTNGWMSFTAPTSSSLTNYPLPNASGQSNQIAPFWDDLDFENALHATTYSDGSRFIIQYTNVEHYPGGAGTTSYTFQVILYPNGRVVYQYQTMSGILNSHTIGIQDSTKSVGLGVTYNENPPYVHDGLAIEFFTIPEWLTIDPTTGVVPAGSCADVALMLNSAGLEDGDYDGLITFTTNDPFHGILDVPVMLHVGQVGLTYVNVDPNTLNLSSNGRTIKATLQLPPEYDPHDIDIDTVSIYGQVFALAQPIDFSDENHDGIQELVVKFDRAAFEALVPEGESVPVTITGEVHDLTWFTGTDHIRALRPRMMAPNGGEYLVGGQPATFTWQSPNGMVDVEYDLILSRDGGATWEALASGIRVTSFTWDVTGPSTGSALVRVFALDQQGVMGYDTSDGGFSIAASLLAPRAVTDLVVSTDGIDLILQWKRPDPDLTHGPVAWYRVYMSDSPQGPFDEIAEVTTESFRDPLANQVGPRVLYFKIAAGNAAGPSAD